MPMVDPFNPTGYDLVSLEETIIRDEHVPTRIGDMGLFEEKSISTTTFGVESKEGALSLVEFSPRGAPIDRDSRRSRRMHKFDVPRIAKGTEVYADEVQNQRAFGDEVAMQNVQELWDERVSEVNRDIEVTVEYGRMTAMKNQLRDADGTVYYDYYNEFGITNPGVTAYPLSGATPNFRSALADVQRGIEDSAGSTLIGDIHCFIGKDVMDSMVDNAEIKEAYDRWQDGRQHRDRYARRSFEFAGVMFEEFRAKVPQPDGTLVDFIADDEMLFFPVGVPGMFKTIYAPAEYFDTVNKPGQPRYVRPNLKDSDDRVMVMDVMSHALSINLRPELIRFGQAT